MQIFPQLASMATVQFPDRKRRTLRTVVNQSEGGQRVKLADDAASRIEWALELTELSDGEASTLRQFFEQAEGRLNEFTFVDPTSNLLLWSEDLSQGAWQRNPLLQVIGGTADPWGTTGGWQMVNPTGAVLSVDQTVAAPAGYFYTFSLYAKSTSGTGLRLKRVTTGASQEVYFHLGQSWKRYRLPGKFDSTEVAVQFSLEVDAGGVAEVAGLQVEAQPTASAYKRTTSHGAVFSKARFDQDEIQISAEAPNRHTCVLRVVSAS